MVELDGDADLASVPQLSQLLTRAFAVTDAGGVIVDVDALTVLDDTALGQLIGAAATARRRERTFSIACTNERVRRRLRETRIDEIIDVVEHPHTSPRATGFG